MIMNYDNYMEIKSTRQIVPMMMKLRHGIKSHKIPREEERRGEGKGEREREREKKRESHIFP